MSMSWRDALKSWNTWLVAIATTEERHKTQMEKLLYLTPEERVKADELMRRYPNVFDPTRQTEEE